MSDQFWIAFFTALPPTLVAIGGVILGYINRKNIVIVKTQTNGMLEAIAEAKHAEGKAIGHALGMEQAQIKMNRRSTDQPESEESQDDQT